MFPGWSSCLLNAEGTAELAAPQAVPQRAIVAGAGRSREGGSFASEVVGMACRFPGNVTGVVMEDWQTMCHVQLAKAMRCLCTHFLVNCAKCCAQ